MIYRQIAHKLRVQMGRGNPDWVSERPRNRKSGAFKDLDEQGRSATLVDVPDGAHVALLLKSGAIQTVETEDVSGEDSEPPIQDMG